MGRPNAGTGAVRGCKTIRQSKWHGLSWAASAIRYGMASAELIQTIHRKYSAILLDLDERGSRRWAAAEAMAIGRGGITAVSKATGIARSTIQIGIKELKSPEVLAPDRQRRPGGGRKSREEEQPKLRQTLEQLIESGTRGDPMSPLRWTIKSTRALARELGLQKFQVSSTKVGELLKDMGYSLQSNRKTIEGKQHPDRNAQFEFIARRAKQHAKKGEPSISVDTKKKEVLGNLKNSGRSYRPSKQPVKVETHDFPKKELGKAIPYGVYDLQHNEALVSVGISHDTALVRSRRDSTLVEQARSEALCESHTTLGHSRLRPEQQPANPTLASPAPATCQCHGPDNRGVPLSTRDE